MRKILLFVLPIIFALGAFWIFLLFFSQSAVGKGALQVTSIPQSNVYVNNKSIGKTPLCRCDPQTMLATGEYTIRLVPVDPALANDTFEQKITINKAVLTVVDRTFGPGATSQGSVISLVPQDDKTTAGLFVASFPDSASVTLDSHQNGETPFRLSSLTASDHDLSIQKNGYKEKDIRIHAVLGYTLSVIAFLGVDPNAIASSSATTIAQPSPVASVSAQVTILNTPTGFLRVHKDANISSAEITQVKPAEQFPLLNEQSGWYEIKLASGSGWISSQYAKKE